MLKKQKCSYNEQIHTHTYIQNKSIVNRKEINETLMII